MSFGWVWPAPILPSASRYGPNCSHITAGITGLIADKDTKIWYFHYPLLSCYHPAADNCPWWEGKGKGDGKGWEVCHWGSSKNSKAVHKCIVSHRNTPRSKHKSRESGYLLSKCRGQYLVGQYKQMKSISPDVIGGHAGLAFIYCVKLEWKDIYSPTLEAGIKMLIPPALPQAMASLQKPLSRLSTHPDLNQLALLMSAASRHFLGFHVCLCRLSRVWAIASWESEDAFSRPLCTIMYLINVCASCLFLPCRGRSSSLAFTCMLRGQAVGSRQAEGPSFCQSHLQARQVWPCPPHLPLSPTTSTNHKFKSSTDRLSLGRGRHSSGAQFYLL